MKKNMVDISVEESGRLGHLRKVDKFHLGRFFVLSALTSPESPDE